MSFEDNILYNYEYDEKEPENIFVASDVQHVYINDLNQSDYSNGWINWSNLNLIGASSNRYFDWSQGYAVIPHGCVLNVDNVAGQTASNPSFGTVIRTTTAGVATTTGYQHLVENALAIAPKGNHNLIDLVQAKFGGASINRNSNYNNFFINEKVKKFSYDQKVLLGDIIGYEIDSAESYVLSDVVGETNNQIFNPSAGKFTGGNSAQSFINQGHLNRLMTYNNDATKVTSNKNIFNTSSTMNDASFSNSQSQGLVGAFDTTGQPVGVNGQSTLTAGLPNRITNLVFQWVSIVPLALVHDFFAQLPSTQSTTGFELRTQLNCALGNSWTVQYSAPNTLTATNPVLATPTLVTASQAVGNTCPYMLTAVGVSTNPADPANGQSATGTGLGCGLNVHLGQPANPFQITIKSFIGYYGTDSNPTKVLAGTGTLYQARLYLPQINYNPLYTKQLIDAPIRKILYEDFYVDSVLGVTGVTGQVNRLFNVQLSRVRNMYIIPFISGKSSNPTKNSAGEVVYRSPLSSAPNTCSKCSISACNIQISGQNIFTEPLQFNSQFYVNNLFSLLGKINGNSLKSDFMTGQITSSMFNKCYNVYSFDLKRVADSVSDNGNKSFQIVFKVDSNNTYDFIVIVAYQNELSVDRLSGMITA